MLLSCAQMLLGFSFTLSATVHLNHDHILYTTANSPTQKHKGSLQNLSGFLTILYLQITDLALGKGHVMYHICCSPSELELR